MSLKLEPVRNRWRRIRQSWREVTRPVYSPEYKGDSERSLNHRYYR